MLITGGTGEQGWAIDEAQIVDLEKGQVEDARLDKTRSSHLSALLPNHSVLIWGGGAMTACRSTMLRSTIQRFSNSCLMTPRRRPGP
ncbi:MAG: hypothetical protein ACREYF_03630 [Gammaproteobacteria bacterium]